PRRWRRESLGCVSRHVRRRYSYHRDSLPRGGQSGPGVMSPVVLMLDLERVRATPLTREPFEFLIVPEFVKADARSAIHNDYPQVDRPGSFSLGEGHLGSDFAKLVEQMRSDEFRDAFEEKFG